jgi:hypothetical protein
MSFNTDAFDPKTMSTALDSSPAKSDSTAAATSKMMDEYFSYQTNVSSSLSKNDQAATAASSPEHRPEGKTDRRAIENQYKDSFKQDIFKNTPDSLNFKHPIENDPGVQGNFKNTPDSLTFKHPIENDPDVQGNFKNTPDSLTFQDPIEHAPGIQKQFKNTPNNPIYQDPIDHAPNILDKFKNTPASPTY